MDIKKIQNANTKYIGKNIEYFKIIDSTQTEAKKNVNQYSNGTVIIADIQTNGKGTHGRSWYTETNNIAMTIILKPKIFQDYLIDSEEIELSKSIKVKQLEGFTISIAEDIKKAIKDLYNIDLNIKLPNDLLLNNKKICGILTEITTFKEKVKEIFVGIGFNVNENNFSEEILNIATSLYKETNKKYVIEDIICKIIENIEKDFEKRI